jgi:16S rRNA (guanine527-N7)-methyltransferase
LLLEWQSRMNLVARSTLASVWTRHIADSLQLVSLAPVEARTWIDLGSGAGFPGLVIACAIAERPGAQVHLVESTGKKVAFMREAVSVSGAPALVHHGRIEEVVPAFRQSVDVVTARALAPLEKLLGYAYPLLRTGALGLFPKGQDVEAELTQASKCWNIKASTVPSITAPESRIVMVQGLAPRRPDGRATADRKGATR